MEYTGGLEHGNAEKVPVANVACVFCPCSQAHLDLAKLPSFAKVGDRVLRHVVRTPNFAFSGQILIVLSFFRSKTAVHHYQGGNVELGTAAGKLFRVGLLTVLDAGDSDLVRYKVCGVVVHLLISLTFQLEVTEAA